MKVRTGKMGMNPIRMAELLENQSEELPSDQIYRELIVNAFEACAKAKKLNPNYALILKELFTKVIVTVKTMEVLLLCTKEKKGTTVQ